MFGRLYDISFQLHAGWTMTASSATCASTRCASLAAGQTPTVLNQTLASTTVAQIPVLETLAARMPSVKWSIIGRSAPVQPGSFQTRPRLLVVSSNPSLVQQTLSAQKDKSVTESSARTSASMTKHVWSTRFVTTESVSRCAEEMRTVTAKRFVRE